MKRSKLYRARAGLFDRQTYYELEKAVELLKQMPPLKFDETVDLAFRLGINPRQADQIVRGAMVLPRGIGKEQKVVVIADGEAAEAAKAAGADEVGYEELIQKVREGWLEFDVMIATPAAMKEVRTLGRVLGPRGLMPNPKTGTVTDDTGTAVAEAKAGRVEYRNDRAGCVMMPVGKLSFEAEALLENIRFAVSTIQRARPASSKGTYLLSLTLSSSMSPGVRIDLKFATKAQS
ncbi:MAG: 50S ribosomal protein L1 [Lentisphaeria bacterium]|jgi:large subunit ribosomal protein L1|nr:50S ribosomal protein L1 [Lentisphaeria bacterium]MDY0175590.1 50S ribosomal protein L1 [Lentisphaeria bacterium]NLZ59897.1 50S ribosomal protein L1 [Lentisphaerota bacterium]